jgi:hypothetical protein
MQYIPNLVQYVKSNETITYRTLALHFQHLLEEITDSSIR